MNHVIELLNPDAIDMKIANGHAGAVAWRRAQEATTASRPKRTWSLSGILRMPVLRHDSEAPKAI
jgi:hypothetical protein